MKIYLYSSINWCVNSKRCLWDLRGGRKVRDSESFRDMCERDFLESFNERPVGAEQAKPLEKVSLFSFTLRYKKWYAHVSQGE
jgi:hypothetical protein